MLPKPQGAASGSILSPGSLLENANLTVAEFIALNDQVQRLRAALTAGTEKR